MNISFNRLTHDALKCGAAVLPLMIALGQTVASAQSAAPNPAPAGTAVASDQETAEATTQDSREIVVTGTQIRGIKPVGSNVLTQTREDIKATGVNDINQVLSQLPQGEFFLGLPQAGGSPRGGVGAIILGAARSPIARPNLRNIPGTNDGSGQPTLVLMDGHRIVPAGIDQAAVDAGVVPVGILERNEIILDGVSAVYGSDAVGGVINLITRKRYDGLEASARYGFGDEYWQTDAAVTAGKTWGTGGITFNVEWAKNRAILNKDREFTRPLNYLQPDPANPGKFLPPSVTGLTCDVPNVQNRTSSTPPGIFHVEGAGLVAGPAYCWSPSSAYTTYNPAQERRSAFVVFQQDVTDRIKFDVTGIYSWREQLSNAGPFTATAQITNSNPYYRCNLALTGTCTGVNGTQRVNFSFGPLLGNDSQTNSVIVQFGQVTPQLTLDLGSWQVRTLVGYGRSKTVVRQTRMDTAAQTALFNGTTFATAINPYDITDSRQNLSLIYGLLRDYPTTGKQSFTQVRTVADGPLFTMAGGDVRLAVGAEWMRHNASHQRTDGVTFALQPSEGAATSSKAVFAEIVVPVVSSANASPGLNELTFSGSGRYDDYGVYGDTFNPKLGLTYKPVEWISVRGSWGKSFRAPNSLDKLNATPLMRCVMQAGCGAGFQNPTGINPNYNFTANGNNFTQLYITGTVPDLRPEKSTGWSIGADISPPIIPGLTLTGSYWAIDFRDQIASAGASVNNILLNSPDTSKICYDPPPAGQPNNPVTQTSRCSAAEIRDFALQAPNGQAILDLVTQGGYAVAFLLDGRVRNISSAKVSGADFSLRYRRDTGFGSVDASVNLTVPLTIKTRISDARPVVNELLTGNPRYRLTASVGATVGQFRAQTTWRFSPGYYPADLLCLADRTVTCPTTPSRLPEQTKVGQFDVFDLSLRYSFASSSALTQDLQLTMNVNNVFDAHPPFNLTQNGGVTGGQTLGRVIQFGFSKKF